MIKKIKNIPFLVIFVLLVHSLFLIVYFTKVSNSKEFYVNISLIIISFFLVGLYSYFFFLLNIFPAPIRFMLNFIFIVGFTFFVLFYYHEGAPLEFPLLWHYRAEMFTKEVMQMMLQNIGLNTKILLMVLFVFVIFVEYKWKILSRNIYTKHRFIKIILSFFLLSLVYSFSIKSFDVISKFNYSIISFMRINSLYPNSLDVVPYQYTNISKANFNYRKSDEEMPNIFFVVVESLKDDVINKKEGSVEFTPYLNSLIKKGLYVENFYGNSVVTSRGQLSILFSLLPSYNSKVFLEYENNKFQSIADILKKYNYETIFYQGYDNLNFDNTYKFLTKNGFNYCKAAKSINFIEDVTYGGVHDFALYDRFFSLVDSLEAQNIGNQKYFGVLATITSHRPYLTNSYCTELPYPNANTIKQNYLNSVKVVDYSLQLFMENIKTRKFLENSIVVIVGDHSVPMGEHGNFLNCNGAYEENFKTPLLILWDKLKPDLIRDVAYSQVDIAPTIIDLLGISHKNHFMGRSILETNSSNSVYLVQPYDGVICSIVDYPFKYIKEISNDNEFLFNVKKDPKEIKNLIESERLKTSVVEFRRKMKAFGINQYLIEKNLVWNDEVVENILYSNYIDKQNVRSQARLSWKK